MYTCPIFGFATFLFASSLFILPSVKSYNVTLADDKFNGTDEQNSTSSPLKVNLNACNDNDPLSKKYCKCTEKVASCDFSAYPGSLAEKKVDLKVYVDSIHENTKRLCICGSPRHVRVNLTKSGHDAKKLASLHRVDIYNMTGPLLITEAFKYPFAGDFYLMNSSYLHSLRSEDFDRGKDMEIQDVQELECCSKIKVNQEYEKPMLYIDFVEINTIHSRGINNFHMWKTVILKYLTVFDVQINGISLDSNEPINVSITNCAFKKVASGGISISNFHNVLLAKNYFDREANDTAFQMTSQRDNSSLVIIDNEFNNGLIWKLYAHRIINWFNMYYFWDSWTFHEYNYVGLSSGRVFSIEYNSINSIHFENVTEIFPNSTGVIFNENVFGSCNCSQMFDPVLPNLIAVNPSRCEPFEEVKLNPSESCLVKYSAAKDSCASELTVMSSSELCKNYGVKKISYDLDTMKKLSFKATGYKIISPFIEDMLRDLKFRFHIHAIFSHSEEDEEKYYANNGDSNPANGSNVSAGLILFLILLLISIIASGIYLVIRRRKIARLVTGDDRSSSYDVLTTAT